MCQGSAQGIALLKIKHDCSKKNGRYKHQLVVVPAVGTTVIWPRDSQKPDMYINEKECTIWLLEVSGLKQRNLEISHECANKNEEFYKPNIKKFLTATNGMPSGKYSGEKPLFLLHPPKF